MIRKRRSRPLHHEGGTHQVDKPTPGYFRTRLRSRGPWVPALVWSSPARDPETYEALDRAPALRCMIDGEEADPWTSWTRLHPVTEHEYRRLCKERADVETEDLMTSKVRL